MKKLNKTLALAGIMLIIIITLTGCEFKLTDNPNRRIIEKKDVQGYTTYNHPSGVQFIYPEHWVDLGTISKPSFADQSTGTNVYLLIESLKGIYSLDSYTSATMKNFKENLGNEIIGEISREDVKLNGRNASILSYTTKQDGENAILKLACFIDDGKVYILAVASEEKNYKDDKIIIDNIINSFVKK